jgi:hypothetical protein
VRVDWCNLVRGSGLVGVGLVESVLWSRSCGVGLVGVDS